MRRSLTLALSVCLLCLSPAVAGVEWPGFRGPNADGSVPGVALFGDRQPALTIGWKADLGSGYSSLAVGGGKVFAMFASGDADVLAAFDHDSGDELWRYRIADTYAGHDGSHDGPISTPRLAGGKVYGLGPYGHLFAVDAETGRESWATHLADDHGGKKPHYGFSTSPVLADGVLVVEIGGEEGKALAGFDPGSGKRLWTLGDDTIGYQSPIVATIGGKRQVIAVGKTNIWGIDAKQGKVRWSYEHGGDDRAMGGHTIVPLPAGDDRLFLMNKIDSSVMLEISKKGEVKELWTTGGIKQSYVSPVYRDGFIFGMSNRLFTCLNADTGEIAWRSREPGDGFPTIVGDKLVIVTKPGSLHVAEASGEGYEELARLDLFEDHVWSEVAYAEGHLFARSMAQLARVDLGGGAAANAGGEDWVAQTGFGRFLAEVGRASDKKAAVDAYLNAQSSFPIVEDDGSVHFVWRGEAEDVGIVGDMIGFRREDPMHRLPGTDLFHYSVRLEPNAAVTYGFMVDYEDATADPLNPTPGAGLFGEVSWFAMPAWRAPAYLGEADPERRGTLEDLEWESAAREGKASSAKVYLPAGYAEEISRRYPVIYVHGGKEALEAGAMKNALDNLIGTRIAPVIAVFVMPVEGREPPEVYGKVILEELVPAIDGKYRTIAEPGSRASLGAGRGAGPALRLGLGKTEVFGRVAVQGASMMRGDELAEEVKAAAGKPPVVYLSWGTYHLRSPHEAWDMGRGNRELWSLLREHGFRPAGGEHPEGFGWNSWRGHLDEMLASLFPRR